MRIAVLMALGSPWSREAVLRLCDLGHHIHIINVLHSSKMKGYLDNQCSLQQSTIKILTGRVQIHEIYSPADNKLRYLLNGFALKSLCLKLGIEVLLTLYGGGFATLACISGFRPFIIYAVGSDILFSTGLKKIINWFTHRAAAKIFTNGVYLSEKTRELTHRDDIENLYLGVDTERFSLDAVNRNDVVILCTRGFKPVYNNEYLIQALALLPEDTPYREVVFSSTGPDLDMAKSLADSILPSSVRKKIRFLEGVSDETLLTYLRQASIYVSLSRSDGTSISLLEALACELFPVVSDIPQNREWIDPTLDNGILVPLDQPNILAEALRNAIMNTKLRQSAGPINRSLIINRADGRKNIKMLATQMEDIIDKYRSKTK